MGKEVLVREIKGRFESILDEHQIVFSESDMNDLERVISKIILNHSEYKENINGLSIKRNIAIDIIDILETALSEKNIFIPGEEREGSENEASIYGEVYYELEDCLTEILNKKISA